MQILDILCRNPGTIFFNYIPGINTRLAVLVHKLSQKRGGQIRPSAIPVPHFNINYIRVAAYELT